MHMQVFDSGLIGEGILHLLAWAHAKLLTPDAILVGNHLAGLCGRQFQRRALLPANPAVD